MKLSKFFFSNKKLFFSLLVRFFYYLQKKTSSYKEIKIYPFKSFQKKVITDYTENNFFTSSLHFFGFFILDVKFHFLVFSLYIFFTFSRKNEGLKCCKETDFFLRRFRLMSSFFHHKSCSDIKQRTKCYIV